MGRNAQPKEIKELHSTGNITRERRRSEVTYTGESNGEVTLPPDHLGLGGQRLWISLVSQLASVKLNFPSTYEYLESYCRAYEVREESWAEMKEHGMYVMEGETDTKPGVRRVSQAYKVYNEQIDKMVLIGAKLGLTPVDKTKISTMIVSDTTKDKNSIKRIGLNG